jgi:GNAT superfamily N-acetyltransferase
MRSSVIIRRATIEDTGPISELLTALAEEFILGDFPEEGRLHLLAHLGAVQMGTRLASPEYRFQVAEVGGAIAGVVAMRGNAHVHYLFVAKPLQRMGLARRLWEVACEEAIRSGNTSGRFTVNASRYAVPAYERLGFRCVGPVQQSNGVRYQPMEWVNGA